MFDKFVRLIDWTGNKEKRSKNTGVRHEKSLGHLSVYRQKGM
jgi:hypothetical protein